MAVAEYPMHVAEQKFETLNSLSHQMSSLSNKKWEP